MISKQVLLSLVAAMALVSASPFASNNLDLPGDDGGDLETVLFKRDSVLTPRELEEAAAAGIDVQKSKQIPVECM